MSPVRSERQVGTVAALWRYPVKSMAAESLDAAEIGWSGVAGDRRWAFVRPDAERNGFPWHTIRDLSTMCRYVARLTDPARPDGASVEVCTPGGATYDVSDPALAAELGEGVRVFRQHRGTFDDSPLTLITSTTVATLCGVAGVPADPRRFRPNLLLTPTDDVPYIEDEWLSAELTIGDAQVRVDQRDPRCTIVDVDPRTGQTDASLLKVIGRERRARAGVYATVVRPGRVGLGDPVTLRV
ncbi:MAG: MOSC domain-containing protein [Propionibacteriaceae bacterium]